MRNCKLSKSLCGVVAGTALLASAAATADVEKERYIIRHTAGQSAAAISAIRGAGGEIKLELRQDRAVAALLPAAAARALSNNPNIELVELDEKRYLLAQSVPYGIDSVQARDVWDADRDGVVDSGAPTGAGVTVCVIDSGLYTGHDDFAGVHVIGGYPSDWNSDGCGHGTHVSGTIAAMNNNSGVVGVSPGDVSLYAVRVFGDSCAWSYSSDLVDAARRCEAAGADVISMSLGGSFSSATEDNTFADLFNNNILSIAAAGNDGNTSKSYPASYDSVVSVAAVDSNDQIASFSQQNDQVEVAAPGVSVLSTVPWSNPNVMVDGTSYIANPIEFAATGSASGAMVNGGLCDSSGSWNGQVVMCERGAISFFDKVMNVQNGGGVAAVIYNNASGNFSGTLGDGNSSSIPAVSLSQEDGQFLVANKLGFSTDVNNTSETPGSGYEAWDGTSMATPHVSAVAALIWSANPTASAQDIRDAMALTARDLGASGRDNAYGWGLVQAADAIAFMGGGTVNDPPTASFSYNCTDLSCSFDGSGSSDSDGSIQSYSWDFGDGNSASGASVSHSFAAGGTYTVTLTVSDDEGASDSDAQSVSVSGSTSNTPPTASFTATCTDLSCSFDGSGSFDSDGSIASYSWDFGDGSTGSGVSANHSYAADGTYTVTLTVTDDAGATDSSVQDISVSDSSATAITLSASPYKHKGDKGADLSWSGATGSSVEIFRTRNGGELTSWTTANDGAYSDRFQKGGTYTYQVCETDGSACSDSVSVSP